MRKLLSLAALCGMSMSVSGQTFNQLKAFLNKQGVETIKPKANGMLKTVAAKAIKLENPNSSYVEMWQLCASRDNGTILFVRCNVNGSQRLYTIDIKDDNSGTYTIKYLTPMTESAWNKKFPATKKKPTLNIKHEEPGGVYVN